MAYQPSKLVSLFKAELQKAENISGKNGETSSLKAENIVSVTDDEYTTALQEAGLIAKILEIEPFEEEAAPRNLEYSYPFGMRLTVAALPLTFGGSDKQILEMEGRWEEFVRNQVFFYILVSDPTKNNLVENFNLGAPGYYYDLLPATVKKSVGEGGCSFIYNPPQKEQATMFLIANLNKALENLKEFLRKESK